MDQDVIIDAIGKHLDAIETYVNAIMLLAVASGWAGVSRSREIDAFGIKFDRRHAFWALSTLFLIGNMTILILFLRIGDLISLLDISHAMKGITTLATHSWVLNPFSYFGDSWVARWFHSSQGYGLLIAVWWLCNASLSILMDDKRNRAAQLLLFLFLVIGLGAMQAIDRVHEGILLTLRVSAPAIYTAVSGNLIVRVIGNLLGIVVGGLIFVVVNRLHTRFMITR